MINAYAFDKETVLTVADLTETKFLSALNLMLVYSADQMQANLTFGFDGDNRLTSFDGDMDIVISMVVDEEMQDAKLEMSANIEITVDYEQYDVFTAPAIVKEFVTYKLGEDFVASKKYYFNDILTAVGVQFDEDSEIKM